VTGLRRYGLLITLLIVCTALWAGLYGRAVQDSRALAYRLDVPRIALNLAIVTGLPLSVAWTIVTMKWRSLLLACAATGTMLAFCFFAAANTENLGYTVEWVLYFWFRRGDIVQLNSLLHLGGETIISYYAASTVLQSSLSIPNKLLYLAYGELIPLAVAGMGLLTRRLARRFRFIPAHR
jgi:hypothetical protein